MSYSRWIGSRWYTYWSASSSSEDKNSQVFRIEDILTPLEFTFKELSEDIEGCLAKVGVEFFDATEDELIELYVYMMRFLNDINIEFKEKADEQSG